MGDYRNTVRGQVETLKRYGNALRSLQRSLESKDADYLETLTSVAVIGRSESFFDPAWKPFQQIHTEGILWLTKKLGPPKAGDDFHSAVVFENFEYLVRLVWRGSLNRHIRYLCFVYWIILIRRKAFHFLNTGKRSFLSDPGWKEATLEAILAYIPEDLRESAAPVMSYCNEYMATSGKLLRDIWTIRNNPQDPANKAMAMQIMDLLSETTTHIEEAWNKFFDDATQLGEISEVVDADSIMGVSYKPSNCIFGGYILLTVTLWAGRARIRYDLSELYGMADAERLWDEYVEVCEELWKYIPWPLRIDRIFAAKTLLPIVRTFDAADEKGKEYLLNKIRDHHIEKHKLPKDREKLIAVIAYQNMVITGRLPMG